MMRVYRLRWGLTQLLVRFASLRQRPKVALARLRPLAARRPADVELRLQLAELELSAGEIDRAIAEAGIAIQLAPSDVRGMSLLLQAQARREAQASTAEVEL
jgi:predicted Zn-dependent protease